MTRLPRTGRRPQLALGFAAAALALAATAGGQEEWPGFRGPARDGRVAGWPPAMGDPDGWPASLERQWRVPVGLGHASPVVHEGTVIVFSREGEEEVLRALDPSGGEDVWRSAYEAPFSMHRSALDHGPGPKSTPEVAAGRVFTLGISGIFSAWDASDGSLLWRLPPDPGFTGGAWPLYGTGSSPAALPGGDRVLVHLGGPESGALVALDAASGATVWELRGDGPAYVTPAVAEVAGVPTVLTMTEERIVLLGPGDGAVLWEMPFTTPYDQNIVTPVVLPGGETVIFAGLGNPTFAVRFRRSGAGLAGETVWEAAESPFYMSNPVRAGDRLIGFAERNSGQFVALDTGTGEILWRSPPRSGENAAVLLAGNTVLALTDAADLFVLDAAASAYAPVRTYEVAPSPTWAHPVPVANGLLIKDAAHLTRWDFR